MREIEIRQNLFPGTEMTDQILRLPAEKGGIRLPGLREGTERWLNLHLEVLEDHAQTFEVRLYGQGEAPQVIIRFGLMPFWPAAVAVDLNWMDGHILFPGHRVGTQKVVIHGSRIAREEIRAAEFVSMPSAAPVRIRLERAWYDDEPCEPLPPPAGTRIDAFGQYTGKDWPGRIHDGEELIRALKREAARENAWAFSAWTPWGGNRGRKLTEGTGFFGRARADNRWYLTDPEGYAFFSLGCDCVTARCDARIDGVESLLEPVPSREEAPELYGERPLPWGESTRKPVLFSYERWNLMRGLVCRMEGHDHRPAEADGLQHPGQLERSGAIRPDALCHQPAGIPGDEAFDLPGFPGCTFRGIPAGSGPLRRRPRGEAGRSVDDRLFPPERALLGGCG